MKPTEYMELVSKLKLLIPGKNLLLNIKWKPTASKAQKTQNLSGAFQKILQTKAHLKPVEPQKLKLCLTFAICHYKIFAITYSRLFFRKILTHFLQQTYSSKPNTKKHPLEQILLSKPAQKSNLAG